MLTIAHLSDLHFSKISILPLSLKRFVGTANLLITRKRSYIDTHLFKLPKLLKSLDVKNILITGDLSSTSLKKEFEKAKEFIDSFDENIKFFLIPGNHDTYTKKALKNSYFKNILKSQNILDTKHKKIHFHNLSKNWVYIGLDTTLVTPIFSASGLFSKEMQIDLTAILDKIPKDKNIIISNHFPIFYKAPKRKLLKRSNALLEILKSYPNIKLYLHGHTHKSSIINKENLPIMICSGCSSHKKNASFNILQIEDDKCVIQSHVLKDNTWQKDKENQFNFS
ncbi:MAG: 3',5'-cyclic adenosine monophosphate phosphodiesterase CpdA [Candidatus Anoxychlamydiales bacterium]|nr:3',5'-cyclic adenosine monophosphate phosphodiesterase CpdA [Candidatus Anoxychlamydiales bacterium]